ncbi:Uma2 family endonuclease [Streptomyces violaceusniger]|uniref:Uma2 family endonuclease n=1 Tax=Streptomyces violaceusniger TaxID=68280 RepID=UPI00193B5743|nr:Uma2 family endonuclease [Streptomyces hygroscopicus]
MEDPVTAILERPMTTEDAPAVEEPRKGPRTEFEELLRTTEELDTPDGYKAELIRGKIVVSPWSRPFYKRHMRSLRLQLAPHVPEGHDADTSPFLFSFPTSERAYGPDLHVADLKAFVGDARHVDGAALSLVAELTSVSTRDVDWQEKLEVYGRHVPVYLVLDMQTEEITAFWDPSDHGYLARMTVPFGKPLPIPAPFGFELETTDFVDEPEEDQEETAK